MNKVLIFLTFLLLSFSVKSQECNKSFFDGSKTLVNIGLNIGGAIPTKLTKGSSALLLPGGYISINKDLYISRRIKFQPSLYAEFQLFGYGAIQSKDTVVQTEVAGIMANVPTYYTATVDGMVNMGRVGLEIPVIFSFQFFSRRTSLIAGVYSNYAFYKSDKVNINVQVGEGGLIPDVDTNYNNKNKINSYAAGFLLGTNIHLNDQFSIKLIAYRDITRFFKQNAILDENGQDIPFFYTNFRIGLSYYFKPMYKPINNGCPTF